MDAVGRQERKRLATRQNIYDTAINLFREKGYHATTVEEIANEADVAKATFFKHFPKKYELIEEVLNQRREKLWAASKDEKIKQLSTKMQISHMMTILCQTIENDRPLSEIALQEFMGSGDLFREEAPSIEIFFQTLERGRKSGELRADVPTRVVARVLWSYYLESYLAWSRNVQGPSLAAMLREGVEIVFRGIEEEKK